MNPETHHGTAAKFVGAVSVAALTLLTPHVADAQDAKAAQAAANNGVDKVVDGLKFHQLPSPGFFMVYDGNKLVGTVMAPPDIPPTINAIVPSYKSKLDAAYAKLANGEGQAPKGDNVTVANAPAPTGNVGGGSVATTTRAGAFDEASKSVTLPDGAKVTFLGDDVKVTNFHGQEFTLHHRDASVGGVLTRSVVDTQRGRVGGSIGGGGVLITQDGSGRKVYDSSEGTAYRGTLPLAKAVAAEVADAINVAKQAGHPDIAPKIAKDLPNILNL